MLDNSQALCRLPKDTRQNTTRIQSRMKQLYRSYHQWPQKSPLSTPSKMTKSEIWKYSYCWFYFILFLLHPPAVFWTYSWWISVDHVGCQGSNMGGHIQDNHLTTCSFFLAPLLLSLRKSPTISFIKNVPPPKNEYKLRPKGDQEMSTLKSC